MSGKPEGSKKSIQVSLLTEPLTVLSGALYEQIDLTEREVKEEAPESPRIASWQSSKAHSIPSDIPPDRHRASVDSYTTGEKSKTKSTLSFTEKFRKGRERSKREGESRVFKTGEYIVKKRDSDISPQKRQSDTGESLPLRQKSGEDSESSFEDAPISLETTEVQYMAYFKIVQQKIDNEWEYPSEAMISGDSGDTEVNFRINSDGTVDDATIFSSSGSETLDKESVSAVFGAAPFPEIPETVGRKRLNIVATFRYSMSFNSGE